MFIPTSQLKDWRDLQDKVAMLFREMGYDAVTPLTVKLAGRGSKEVDVYIHDPRASVNQVMLVECKYWESPVPQDTVHSFHTIMSGAGANTGFIISKVGFQSGAYEAASSTNIHLLSWDELQRKLDASGTSTNRKLPTNLSENCELLIGFTWINLLQVQFTTPCFSALPASLKSCLTCLLTSGLS
ncbi:restriction endonuclease [Bradyrhizobium sp. Pear77]|nr:restriction endonuclease [Bradyrhizobium altum]